MKNSKSKFEILKLLVEMGNYKSKLNSKILTILHLIKLQILKLLLLLLCALLTGLDKQKNSA